MCGFIPAAMLCGAAHNTCVDYWIHTSGGEQTGLHPELVLEGARHHGLPGSNLGFNPPPAGSRGKSEEGGGMGGGERGWRADVREAVSPALLRMVIICPPCSGEQGLPLPCIHDLHARDSCCCHVRGVTCARGARVNAALICMAGWRDAGSSVVP